jgi:hypothetical protein
LWSWSSAVKIAPVWILRQIIGQSARRIANPRCHLGYEQLIADIDRLTADGTISLDPPWAKRKKQIFMHTYPRTVNPEVDPEGAYKEMNTLLKQRCTIGSSPVAYLPRPLSMYTELSARLLNRRLTSRSYREIPASA